MPKPDKAYIGISPCGCVTAAMVVGIDAARSEKAELKRWMRTGRRVEITTTDDARQRLTFGCRHKQPPSKTEIATEADRLVKEARDG